MHRSKIPVFLQSYWCPNIHPNSVWIISLQKILLSTLFQYHYLCIDESQCLMLDFIFGFSEFIFSFLFTMSIFIFNAHKKHVWVNWVAAFYHHQSAVDAENLWGHQTVVPESCQQKHPPHFYANRCVLVRPPVSLGAAGNNRHGTVQRLIINHTFVFVRLKRHSVSISHTHRDKHLEESIQGPKLMLLMMESIRSLHGDIPHDLTNISVRHSLLSRCPSTQNVASLPLL